MPSFNEHSNFPSNYGAWYIAGLLDALTSDPEVWSRTALFITYDESDGFFDHTSVLRFMEQRFGVREPNI